MMMMTMMMMMMVMMMMMRRRRRRMIRLLCCFLCYVRASTEATSNLQTCERLAISFFNTPFVFATKSMGYHHAKTHDVIMPPPTPPKPPPQ